jgi:hypothetical protein
MRDFRTKGEILVPSVTRAVRVAARKAQDASSRRTFLDVDKMSCNLGSAERFS